MGEESQQACRDWDGKNIGPSVIKQARIREAKASYGYIDHQASENHHANIEEPDALWPCRSSFGWIILRHDC
jgi:hypothetical protein